MHLPPSRQMPGIVSSASMASLSSYHRALSMVFSSLGISWEDLGLKQTMSQEVIYDRLTTALQVDGKNCRSFPSFCTNLLKDCATHPLHGFPQSKISSIKTLFCKATKPGWTHARLLGACTALSIKGNSIPLPNYYVFDHPQPPKLVKVC